MKFYTVFIECEDTNKVNDLLVKFKKDLQVNYFASVTVIDLEQSNYDFLYNSLIERARQEEKGR
jgi:hypothetical protein